MTFPVRFGAHGRFVPPYAVAMVAFVGVPLLAFLVGNVQAQPLQWSPNRTPQVKQPHRVEQPQTLESLASAPTERRAPQALLIRNPDTSGGAPGFALADEYGRVQRFVEPSPGVELASYVGQQVRIRHDTGETLLASQLELPLVMNGPNRSNSQRILPPTGVVTAGYQSVQPSVQPLANSLKTAQVSPIVVSGMPAESFVQEIGPYGPPLSGDFVAPYGTCESCPPTVAYQLQPNGPSCCRGSRGRFYGRAEYLLWQFDGMQLPPLVTTSPAGTPQAQAGVLGQPGTEILFGGGSALGGTRNGVRLMVGTWLNDYRDIGIEADWIWFDDESVGFSRTGVQGAPILARPFFNMVPLNGAGDVLPPAEDAELVSFPGVVEGTVSVDVNSEFRGAGLRFRAAMCCQELGTACSTSNCGDACGPASPWGVSRIDIIGGYRFLRLDERVLIRENLTSLQSVNPGTFDISDRFDTSNQFHGADIGFIWEWESTRWSFEFLSKVAIGNTDQRVDIRGQTIVSNNGVSFTNDGGLLALQSNIGTYQRDVFSMVPEIGLTIGYRLTPRLRATAGYTLLYWSQVVRPGSAIDLDVNPNLIPPVIQPVVGPDRPRFTWDDTALLAHGLNLGLDYRF